MLLKLLLSAICFSQNVSAATEPTQKPSLENHGEAFGFSVENDARVIGGPGSDQAYTNGVKISYAYSEDHVPVWAEATLKKNDYFKSEPNQTKINFGLSLAQQIYTPADVDKTEFIANDRRYAGWIYLGFSAQIKTELRAELIELDLGLIGPSALGEPVQNNFHKIIRSTTSNGWSNQMSDEPTVQASYQQKIRLYELHNKNGKFFDVIPYYGAGFGNVHIGAHVGGLIRFGKKVPDDFGPSRLSASDGESFISEKDDGHDVLKNIYVFVGARGNGILRDIFLDGNTFRSNRTVSKNPFILETEFGLGTQLGRWNLVWRFISRTADFQEINKLHSFASINILYLN